MTSIDPAKAGPPDRAFDPATLTLRRAAEADASDVAAVFIASRLAAMPAMPPPIHSEASIREFIAGRVQTAEVWVACSPGRVLGILDLTPTWLDSLYVLPQYAGRGIGTALLGLAKARRPAGFGLWVFESNVRARSFYRREGLVELEHTDGSANEERSPDVRMVWPGESPLTFLRQQMDEVDDDLAVVLTRRSALTAAIQRFKEVPGEPGRDYDREAAIARRMAERAPGLDQSAWQRIMHEVISVSLEAAERGKSSA